MAQPRSLQVCSGSSPTSPSSEATSSASDALTIIKHCQSESASCNADAGDAGRKDCDDRYRVCLGVFSPDAGKGFSFDGGGFEFDAGGFHVDDAGFPPPEQRDGGDRIDTDLAKIDACLVALRGCVESKTALDTCADDAVTCLEDAVIPSADAGAPSGSDAGGGPFGFPFPPPSGPSWPFPLPHHGGRP